MIIKCVVLHVGLKIDEKKYGYCKSTVKLKIDVKEKELVQRKQKLISTSTRCKSTSPYMTSQEVVLRLRAYNQKQNGALASKL